MDAWPGVGDAWIRRRTRISVHASCRSARGVRRTRRPGRCFDAARATCDYYIDIAACADGIPYWDTGAPGLATLATGGSRPADPFNDREPVDSSAAAIAAQGLLRLGRFLNARGEDGAATGRPDFASPTHSSTRQALPEPVASASGAAAALGVSLAERVGLCPRGRRVPRGESSQWGDYHAREVALYRCGWPPTNPISRFMVPRRVMADRERHARTSTRPSGTHHRRDAGHRARYRARARARRMGPSPQRTAEDGGGRAGASGAAGERRQCRIRRRQYRGGWRQDGDCRPRPQLLRGRQCAGEQCRPRATRQSNT